MRRAGIRTLRAARVRELGWLDWAGVSSDDDEDDDDNEGEEGAGWGMVCGNEVANTINALATRERALSGSGSADASRK